MRPLFRIAGVLCMLLGMVAAPSADAQDVQADAPVFVAGDKIDFVDERGIIDRTVVAAEGTTRTYRIVEPDGDVWLQYYDESSNRTLSEREDGGKRIVVRPSTGKYDFPLFVGKTWSGSNLTTVFVGNGMQSVVTEVYRTDFACEVQCIELIEVPAGRFEAFRISCEQQRSDRPFAQRQTYWFSPVVGGNVRNEFVRTDTNEIYDRYELHGFARATYPIFDVLPDGVESSCLLTVASQQ